MSGFFLILKFSTYYVYISIFNSIDDTDEVKCVYLLLMDIWVVSNLGVMNKAILLINAQVFV